MKVRLSARPRCRNEPAALVRSAGSGPSRVGWGLHQRGDSVVRSAGNRAVARLHTADPPGGRKLPGRVPYMDASAEAGVRSLNGSGEPLPLRTRAFFERRFNRDFGDVRIHRDGRAARLAGVVNARAFTIGNDVAFGAGEFAPDTRAGRHLIAHELTHVVQQSGASWPASGELEIDAPDSGPEREAEGASRRLLRDGPVQPVGGARRLPRQRLQRAEYGTYVSNHGTATFLDAAARFYRSWGHPNVRRVDTIDDVLRDLDRGSGALDTFRIVAHANPAELLIGLSSALSPTSIDREALEFHSAARFRARLAETRLLSDAAYTRIVSILQSDATTQPFLTTLGIETTVPSTTSAMGIMLRAIAEAHYLDTVELDTGGPPQIPDRAILDRFNSDRLATYRAAVLAAFPATQRQVVRRAIDGIIANLGAALNDAGFTFDAISQHEADDLADPVAEAAAGGVGRQLRAELPTMITEGGGSGPFLGRLGRVRQRVTTSTHIRIRGCQIGQNPEFLDDFRAFMGRAHELPSISAPDLFQYYFPLNFETFPATATGDADLDAAFSDPQLGVARDFALQHHVRQGDMIPVAIEESPAAFIQRYGLAAQGIDEAALERLNPEIRDWSTMVEGTDVFLRARQVDAAPSTSLEHFARRFFGSRFAWPTVWGFNPHIRTPHLSATDRLWLQSERDRNQFGVVSATPGLTELRAAIRGGEAVVSIEATAAGTAPRIRVDDPQRAAAMGRWLERQQFDPRGRTAQVLSRLFAGGRFGAAALRLHMKFLSRSFPNVVDPIFPDDPRFDAHIIRR